MKTCPFCKKEIPKFDWNCPYCHHHVGSLIKGVGHSTKGTFNDDIIKHPLISKEDNSMIKEDDSASDYGDDYDY